MNVKNYRKSDSKTLFDYGIKEKALEKFHQFYDKCPYLTNFEITITQDKNKLYLIEVTITAFHIRLYHFEITPEVNSGFLKATEALELQLHLWKKDRFSEVVQLGA